jgi:5-methylcytosine-specific restriction endonuclease McrA
MSHCRYSTAAWQRVRKAVLRRDGYVCQVQGPRCLGHATTVHHIAPGSQAPHLFWAEENLVAACSRCNYCGGARVAAQNTRQTIERLQQIIGEQQQEIAQLAERLAHYEDQVAKRRVPAIH